MGIKINILVVSLLFASMVGAVMAIDDVHAGKVGVPTKVGNFEQVKSFDSKYVVVNYDKINAVVKMVKTKVQLKKIKVKFNKLNVYEKKLVLKKLNKKHL